MKPFDHIRKAYFLGIGGIGMSAIARYFNVIGIEVFGYDKTVSHLTKSLENEGMDIHYEDDISRIPTDVDLVVFTPAIPQDLNEFVYLKRKELPLLKRAEVLGLISKNVFTIAVSGTHGKTSVSSLIAHMLYDNNKDVMAFVGGIMKNYRSNCIINDNPSYIVVEADEYDKSFLQLYPNILIINSLDEDHLDIYGDVHHLIESFKQLCDQVDDDGEILCNETLQEYFETHKAKSFGTKNSSAIRFKNKKVKNGFQSFDFISNDIEIKGIKVQQPGYVNILNTIVAIAVALECGVSVDGIRKSLENYQGVERRFDFRVKNDEYIYIDDYAHHPEEINALVEAIRSLYPKRKITGIFQPHLYSRTRDFAKAFAESLDQLDEVILLPIYPAREKEIEGISSKIIFDEMTNPNKLMLKKEELFEYIKEQKPSILLTIGAGDIDRMVKPIEKLINCYE